MAKADLIIKGQEAGNLVHNDTLLVQGHPDQTFSYCLANPPFGQDWKVQQKAVKRERERDGENGRFGAGLPGVVTERCCSSSTLLQKCDPPIRAADVEQSF